MQVSGRHANVQAVSVKITIHTQLTPPQVQHDIEKDEESFSFTEKDDIYVVASVLKVCLRLPTRLSDDCSTLLAKPAQDSGSRCGFKNRSHSLGS